MRLITLFAVLICLSAQSLAQITVSARYVSNNSKAYDINYGIEDALNNGYEIGLGYWFRLKNKRMEFTPEISYTALRGSGSVTGSSINFNSNILIYALDFHSDCSACPTFSKEGGLIKKGFHWIINPSLTRVNSDFNATNKLPLLSDYSFTTWRLGIGAGLDIGLTNLLTIAPFAILHIGGEDNLHLAETEDSRYRQVHIGVRAILRFDKDKW